ncbi:MAG TPA: competence/damage-inducible protein A, partial [Fimbriimonas sp.]|nr:competence/damage-inducible protein A [Fimbriimonas sp.]
MTAEIVSVGTELLLGHIVDTHAPVMARILAECGIGCTRRVTVGDNWDRLMMTLLESLDRADIVITIGGLGPTMDDLTRDAIAAAMQAPLENVPDMEEKLRKFFASRNLSWLESIGRQAQRPAGGKFIDNPNGTAPGLWVQKNGKTVVALPGPKGEFMPMANGPVKEMLSRLEGDSVIHSRTLRIVGMGESMVEDAVKDLMDSDSPTVAPYAHTGEVHLRLTARARSVREAEQIIVPMETEIRSRLGSAVFGVDDETLEHSVIRALTARSETLAVAESMTGGELGARLTTVDGSSKAFLGGGIVYSPLAKVRLAGVREETIKEHGPVSAQAAKELAEGIRNALGATYGIAITGNAGPTPDVDNKP